MGKRRAGTIVPHCVKRAIPIGLADRLLRVPVCADRLPGGAELQRLPTCHRLGRIFVPLVCRLWHDQPLIDAALLSLRIAAVSATLALIVGTLAGYALARFGRFPARGAFTAALAAPLVLPEVITGLSLLLLFVTLQQAIGWPAGRGAGTITLAHASVSVAYVAVVVHARLADTPADLEEAATDLYAPPWRAFALITLPLLAPALVSGWLLAFTLSLDDVVVASFTSGPGASTLPMVVFSSIKLGPTPELYALATVIVAGVAVILLGVGRAEGCMNAA